MAWHPRDNVVAISTGKAIEVRDVDSGAVTQSLPNTELALAWHPDGKRIAALTDSGLVLWEPVANKRELIPVPELRHASIVDWSPDGKQIAAFSRLGGPIMLWNSADGKLRAFGPSLKQWGVCWSPDSTKVAASSINHTLLVWDVATGRLAGQYRSPRSTLTEAIAFSPDGRWLASGWDNGEIHVLNAKDLTNAFVLPGHDNQVVALGWTKNGSTLISASWDGTIKLWDVDRHNLITTLTGHHAGIHSLSLSPDGARFVTCSPDQTCRIWSARDGRSPRTLLARTGWIQDILWRRDARTLVVATDEGTIDLLDTDAGRVVKRLTGHGRRVTSMSFAPGETRLVSGDGSDVILWNLETGKLLARHEFG